ncbi:hypothetical protein GCM10029992_62580 [Glycomyces albus]
MCAQYNRYSQEITGSEDCLFLNMYTPADADGTAPVIVYVPGGGFVSGEGAAYDPTRFVERSGAVVVTVNYRLGALGFLAHPELDDPDAGNFGLADQRQALRWIEQNIASFGGDPGNVTLWGQSAGGFSVCAQLASPAAAGLFDKAIVQSASCANQVLTEEEAEARAKPWPRNSAAPTPLRPPSACVRPTSPTSSRSAPDRSERSPATTRTSPGSRCPAPRRCRRSRSTPSGAARPPTSRSSTAPPPTR